MMRSTPSAPATPGGAVGGWAMPEDVLLMLELMDVDLVPVRRLAGRRTCVLLLDYGVVLVSPDLTVDDLREVVDRALSAAPSALVG